MNHSHTCVNDASAMANVGHRAESAVIDDSPGWDVGLEITSVF